MNDFIESQLPDLGRHVRHPYHILSSESSIQLMDKNLHQLGWLNPCAIIFFSYQLLVRWNFVNNQHDDDDDDDLQLFVELSAIGLPVSLWLKCLSFCSALVSMRPAQRGDVLLVLKLLTSVDLPQKTYWTFLSSILWEK